MFFQNVKIMVDYDLIEIVALTIDPYAKKKPKIGY
jgi:hypothetical protein